MENTTEIIFDKLVYSCAFESYRGHEEFIPDHFLGFQISGETHAFHEHGKTVIKEKTVVLVRKNQLIRTIKYPSAKEKYQFISITLDDETLRQYAAENKIVVHTNFPGDQRLFFEPDDFFKRLKEAYYLIKNRDKKPSDIYLDLGFENLSHFYSSFKKKFGMTTTEV